MRPEPGKIMRNVSTDGNTETRNAYCLPSEDHYSRTAEDPRHLSRSDRGVDLNSFLVRYDSGNPHLRTLARTVVSLRLVGFLEADLDPMPPVGMAVGG
jgi:hypothetical protein